MKNFLFLATAAFTLFLHGNSMGEANSAPRVEILLNKISAEKSGLGTLRDNLALTPNKLLLICDQEYLYVVGWGGTRRIETTPVMNSFAYTPDGLLMGTQRRDLVYVDKEGAVKKLFILPSPGMGIATGLTNNMFLFERNRTGTNGLYLLTHGKKVRKLFDSPQAIAAVTETKTHGILFAAGNGVYSFGTDKNVQILAGLPDEEVKAIAAAPESDTFYFSGKDSVFSLKNGQISIVTRRAGGLLYYLDDGLVIFDPKKPLLIRIAEITKTDASASH